MNRGLPVILFLLIALLSAFALQSPKSKETTPSAVQLGEFTNGVYQNFSFGFTYKVPFGWVDRTDDMRESGEAQQPSEQTSKHPHQASSIVLLATFEHPPEATTDTINSAVVIAAEPVSAYPGLRNAEQYFGPLSELTRSKGFTVANEPYEFNLDAKSLTRADFSKELGKLTMHQSTLAMMQKAYIVSFTFIGGSDDEVDELIEGLKFLKTHEPARRK
jgi:hypothetical protein